MIGIGTKIHHMKINGEVVSSGDMVVEPQFTPQEREWRAHQEYHINAWDVINYPVFQLMFDESKLNIVYVTYDGEYRCEGKMDSIEVSGGESFVLGAIKIVIIGKPNKL